MQKNKYLFLILLLVIEIIFSTISCAQVSHIRNQVFIGARPMGMGETFVAVADDGNAIYWNPAGLPHIDRYELYSMHSNFFDIGIKNNYLSLLIPYSEKIAFGIDWLNLNFADEELAYSHNTFNFSFGMRPFNILSVGMNLKRLTSDASLDRNSRGKASGWGVDLGVLILPGSVLPFLKGLKLGIMAHDFTDSQIKYDTGVSSTIFFRNVRYGACYEFKDLLFFRHPLMAFDIDDRFHIGMEFWLPSWHYLQLGFRTGLQKDIYPHGEEELTNSFGTSIKYQIKDRYILNFDYSYTDSPALINTSRFSIGFSFSLPVSPVKIDTVFIKDIYASLYPFHAETSCGMLKCKYYDNKKLDVTVKIKQSQYDISSEAKFILNPDMQPGDTLKKVNLVPIFSEKILAARGEDRVRANIVVQPRSLMRMKPEKSISNDFTIYGIGKINWEKGEEQLAAFITPDDPIVRDLAVNIIKEYQNFPITINEAVTHACQIFTDLGERGIRYLGDIKSTFGKKPIDTIYYPRELLTKKMGDCDDTTVLLASLFQSAGISTALVSVEGHIFIMFDTGINKAKRLIMSLSPGMYHLKGNNVWIPIETTLMGKTFIEAWEKGANLLMEFTNQEEIKIVDVSEAGQQYKPIPIKTLEKIISKPEVLSCLYSQDMKQQEKTIAARQKEYIISMEKKVKQYPDSIKIRNELATTYSMTGNTTKAKQHYITILNQDTTNFGALNNMANVYFLEGKLDSAQNFYTRALVNAQTSKDSNGVYLNLGTLYAAADNVEFTYEMYSNLVRDLPDTSKMEAILISRVEELLGLTFKDIELTKADEKKKLTKISSKRIKKLVKDASAKKIKSKGKKISKPITTKGRKFSDEIEDVFFWVY